MLYNKTINKMAKYNNKQFSNKEGVFLSPTSKKWVVVVKNTNIKMRGCKPFISLGQYADKGIAEDLYNEHKKKFPD